MFSLFETPRKNYQGLNAQFELHDFERKTVEDVERVVDYYRKGAIYVQNTHLIVKLINTLAVPMSYALDDYYEICYQRSLYVATALGMTSSINYGKWFKGEFYHGCDEIIIAYNGEDNPHELKKNWMNLKPIQVIEAPITNFGYLPPDGQDRQSEQGLVVLGIDVSMLMLQYRCYMELQYNNQAQFNMPMGTTAQFVSKYVIPNMIYSQTDLAIFNRMVAIKEGIPIGAVKKRHPFYISDYTQQFTRGIEPTLKRLKNSQYLFANYLEQFPKVFNDHPLQVPSMAETRQVWWALFLSRVRVMNFMLDLAGEAGIRANYQDIGKLKVIAKQFNSDGIFNKRMPNDYDVEARLFLRRVMALK